MKGLRRKEKNLPSFCFALRPSMYAILTKSMLSHHQQPFLSSSVLTDSVEDETCRNCPNSRKGSSYRSTELKFCPKQRGSRNPEFELQDVSGGI